MLSINLGGSHDGLFNALDAEAAALLLREHRIAGPWLGWHLGRCGSHRRRAEWGYGGAVTEADTSCPRGRHSPNLDCCGLLDHDMPVASYLCEWGAGKRPTQTCQSAKSDDRGPSLRDGSRGRTMAYRGDWNFTPDQLGEWWEIPWGVQQVEIFGPTQRHGRYLDWYLGSRRLPIQGVGTEVVPGTDHVGVPVTLGTPARRTLGRRMASPTPTPTEALEAAGKKPGRTSSVASEENHGAAGRNGRARRKPGCLGPLA